MGLDWIVNYKPIEGNESSFYKIKNRIKKLDKEAYHSSIENEIDDLRNSLKKISITPEDTINILSEQELQETDNIFEGGSFLTSNHDFRGQVISCSELLNETLIEEAYVHHGAKKSIEYANKLEHSLSEYKYDELEEEEQEDYNYIIRAIKWLRFWGKHGHGFTAWY
jgi:hypothetical protein